MEKYDGDMLLISRLAEYFCDDYFQWNYAQPIMLSDIDVGVINGYEEREEYGNQNSYLDIKEKDNCWHIKRVVYFINHPEEIKDIEIDNMCDDFGIIPAPVVIDGNHRLLAAIWLNKNRGLEKIHSMYGGDLDLLDYLTGESDDKP